MRKIVYITGSRADYGLMKNVLEEIEKSLMTELTIIATGMHIMPEFGETASEIIKDKFNVVQIHERYEKDDLESMAKFIGRLTVRLSEKLAEIKPDIILLLGDRGEMLAGAIVGSYMNIPVAHVHGGDISRTVDDSARHAITKLSHIHFPATKKSAERILQMGEEPWRVHVVGAPGLDAILKEQLIEAKKIGEKYNLDLSKPILLMIQHPVTTEIESAAFQIKETLDAIVELKHQTILIYPNSDAGGRRMIEIIKKYEKYPFIKTFKSIPHKEYLSLMKVANVLVGNSSSGIIEAPSFHLPVVNIGTRQEGRERGENVIDVGYDKKQIKNAVETCLYDKSFIEKTKNCVSPYGTGGASKKIAKILAETRISRKLLEKKFYEEST